MKRTFSAGTWHGESRLPSIPIPIPVPTPIPFFSLCVLCVLCGYPDPDSIFLSLLCGYLRIPTAHWPCVWKRPDDRVEWS
ncbi:MAG: hypothetical protein PHG55_05715, partial [Verrucomicrobiota bacterium]|nr:hypothetical protein [Verrucomicrobiota bacterium]